MTKKKTDEASSEYFYNESLKELLFQKWADRTLKIKTLRDGRYENEPFYPKSRLYQDFVKHLKDLNVQTIGTKKFTSLLRDFGFIEGDTIMSERYDNYPTPCLIFSKNLQIKLGLISSGDILK